MTHYIPRRRVSSRTKKRCRIIKDFVCKALGKSSKTSSQGRDKTHSSIELSISDLKQKISGIETQLDKISKHCNNLTSRENINQCETHPCLRDELCPHETKILYKARNSVYKNANESASSMRDFLKSSQRKEHEKLNQHGNVKSNVDCRLQQHKYTKISAPSLENIRHIGKEQPNINTSGYSVNKRKHSKKVHQKPLIIMEESCIDRNYDFTTLDKKRKKPKGRDSSKRKYSELGQEFISNIIRKQYKPVKLYTRRTYDDISQFSVPVCRDRELSMRNTTCDDCDVCYCCFDKCKKHNYTYSPHSDVKNMKSFCDARLSKSKRRARSRRALDDYNNSEYYDLVPVKEKSSPKSRKKFFENNTMTRDNYIEVPPSPKTQRPRLNLKATVYDDYDDIVQCTSIHDNCKNPMYIDDDSSPKVYKKNRKNITKDTKKRPINRHDSDNEAIESLINNDASSKQNANECTDKTLDEIKDLLQSFLTVIKKDSIHNDNEPNVTKHIGNKPCVVHDPPQGTNVLPSVSNGDGGNAGNSNIPPVIPMYPNNCCYPIMPMYPVNYMQNGCPYPIGSNHFMTCSTNTEKPKKCLSSFNLTQDELIKEIHEIVTQSPNACRKHHARDKCPSRKKCNLRKRRSTGNSSVGSRCNPHLAQSTPRCISRSCEAIGPRRKIVNHFNESFSETVIEAYSVEARRSSTDLELSSDSSLEQAKGNKPTKLKDILRPWKWKKNKRDVTDEFSESESIGDVPYEVPPPFGQNIMNYAMHEQEFYHPPPINRRSFNDPHTLDSNPTRIRHPNPVGYKYGKPTGYPIKRHYLKHPKPQGYINKQHYPRFEENPQFSPYYDNLQNPQYQNYDPHYPNQPQVPLCLKEVEVKSMGTQSERKGLFKKFTHKVQQDAHQQQKAPVKQPILPPPAKAKSGIFNWKSFQEKSMVEEVALDQKRMTQKNENVRNAMIKKMFYKKNPFSPRNLILRTLLGNDPSSYGNRPKYMKPKLFV